MPHLVGREVAPGVYTTQDPKYHFDTNICRLVNAGHGRPIPDDVPVFMMLGHDHAAIDGMEAYIHKAIRLRCDKTHLENVGRRIDDFEVFRANNVTRMKLPITSTPIKEVKHGST